MSPILALRADGQLTAPGLRGISLARRLDQPDPTCPWWMLVSPGLSPRGRRSRCPSGACAWVQPPQPWVRGCHQLAPISLLQLSPRTGQTELPLRSHSAARAATVPPAAFSLPATTATHLPFFHPRPCFWDLWFALSPPLVP